MTDKTTIRNIDPDILWDAKIYAAQTKLTMGEVVTIALERLIQEGEGSDQLEVDPSASNTARSM